MESVKQRIADLESAGKVVGGLSLSSEFELACLCELVAVTEQVRLLTEQRDALVAENSGMDEFVDTMLKIAWRGGSADGFDIQDAAIVNGLIRAEVYCADKHENLVEDPSNFEDGDTVYLRVETPAHDAAIASLRADAGATAIEQFALLMRSPGDDPFLDAVAEGVAGAADNFARQLRESKGEVSNG